MEWFNAQFDGSGIRLEVEPPGGSPWRAEVEWTEIERVCFRRAEDFLDSDEVILYVRRREAGYLIPIDAVGGIDLLSELMDRRLVPADRTIDIPPGEVECWPG